MKLGKYAVVLWTLGFLAAGELALELRAAGRGWETFLFGPPPTAEQPADSPFGPTDAYPFRSRIVPAEKPAGTLRVWIASASYGEHIFLPADQIFPVRLEDELRERGLDVQVINASRASLSARVAVEELATIAPAWDVDVAVLYHLSNDLDGLSAQLMATGSEATAESVIAQERARLDDEQADLESGDEPPWPTALARRTTLYEQAKNQLGARLTPIRMLASEVEPEVAEVFETRARDFVDAARALGVRPVLASFATSHPPGHPEPLPSGFRRNLYRHNGVLAIDGWRSGAADWNDRLGAIAADTGTALIDVADAVAGRSGLFVDFVHFTPEGHAEVARTLADGLAPILAELQPQ